MLLRFGTPILVAFLLLFGFLVSSTLVNAQGGCGVGCEPSTPSISVLIEPETASSLVYTNTNNTINTVWIPTQAVTQPTLLRYTALTETTAPTPENMTQVGVGFALDAFQDGEQLADFSFEEPPTITVQYLDADIVGLDEAKLTLTFWDGAAWQDVLTACGPAFVAYQSTILRGDQCGVGCQPIPIPYERDLENNRLTAPLCHLTEFALLGTTPPRLFVPILSRE